MQLKEVTDGQKAEFGFVDVPTKPCTVTTTLKYDLSLYLDRILQACKRTKVKSTNFISTEKMSFSLKTNLMLLRVSRTRSTNTTLLLVASTHVRVEQLNRKVQLLVRLVKENGGEFQTIKKIKKKPLFNLMAKDDLHDYVEIALSFRMVGESSQTFR